MHFIKTGKGLFFLNVEGGKPYLGAGWGWLCKRYLLNLGVRLHFVHVGKIRVNIRKLDMRKVELENFDLRKIIAILSILNSTLRPYKRYKKKFSH